MAKMKTHRGAGKRFRVTRKGKVMRRKAFLNHNLGKKSSRRKRRLHAQGQVTAEKRTVLRLLGRR
jgi:large subunit ribosomal protein L35